MKLRKKKKKGFTEFPKLSELSIIMYAYMYIRRLAILSELL